MLALRPSCAVNMIVLFSCARLLCRLSTAELNMYATEACSQHHKMRSESTQRLRGRTSGHRRAVCGICILLILSKVNFAEHSLLESSETSIKTVPVDVSWLQDVQRSEKDGNSEGLRPLLTLAGGTQIQTRAQWNSERKRLRQRWLTFLGPMPTERPPVRMHLLREDRLPDGCVRQLVQYSGELGRPVEGYLLFPRPDKSITKRAGIVAFHPTADENIHEIAGVRGGPDRDLAVQLARRGFVVFCPKCFLWQDTRAFDKVAADFKKRRPNTLGMHKMLWDGMRALDVLEQVPIVDANRIGATGHSLGAKETLYLTAFDDSIKAAVASEGGIGLSFSNWDAPWYLGKGIHAENFELEHHELLALAAPRPFLIIAGESGPGAADGERSWRYCAAALPVYRLFCSPAPLGLYNHHQGHSFPKDAFERTADWLETYLQN